MAQQTAIVTGGGGGKRSIGGAIVRRLRSKAMRVAVLDIGPRPNDEEYDVYEQCDLTDPGQVEAAMSSIVGTFGAVDHLISNAAFSHRRPLLEINVEQFSKTLDVTLFGAFHVIQATAKHMVPRRRGNIVVIGSPHALPFWALPGAGDYNAAKGALQQLMLTLAAELWPHRINVNAVQPGWIDTPNERKLHTSATIRAEHKRRQPWGLGRPTDVANVVAYLCSRQALRYTTGSVFAVDGGLLLPSVLSQSGKGPHAD